MTIYEELPSSLRGSALESRDPISVIIGQDETEAIRIVNLLTNHVIASGVTAHTARSQNTANGDWSVHYYRGELSPWPAPRAVDRKVGP